MDFESMVRSVLFGISPWTTAQFFVSYEEGEIINIRPREEKRTFSSALIIQVRNWRLRDHS